MPQTPSFPKFLNVSFRGWLRAAPTAQQNQRACKQQHGMGQPQHGKKGVFTASQVCFVTQRTAAHRQLLPRSSFKAGPAVMAVLHLQLATALGIQLQGSQGGTRHFFFSPSLCNVLHYYIPPTVSEEKSESRYLIFPILIERSHAFSTSYCIIPLYGVALIQCWMKLKRRISVDILPYAWMHF